ncbi:ABC transporter ATP-binding protein [Sphingomicrobium astaxanthinifaciens]|uniref:ABC transporter ATP-binding protein n=1 Tax=Sphingomicrobium astaxanthinifaciens TaxID=1227949 RepID=UPI001FCC5F94|nr:ATP-binding cassette domain-containing protein [Sphingomicrobium astaxanthinifaciens]MCJ7421812.1 ATP-binding cassette domain-containing protein [Sphingomicrobium astaxanthinifaciens]
MSILSMQGVTKRFGDITAVDRLDMHVAPGEIFGFLGGNGAGKTTSLRMILDIIRPTEGRIAVLGEAPGQEHADRIGFLPEERGLYPSMKAIDTITYFGRLKGMDAATARAEGMALLERFDLAERATSPIADMSKGMAQKVQLATALVNRPDLLILDEPFSGLDPVNQQLLEAEIVRAARRGAAVVFSTHIMQHAERLCDRLLILRRGVKKFEGDLAAAQGLVPPTVRLTARADLAARPGIAAARILGRDGDWTRYEVDLSPDNDPGTLLETLTREGVLLRDFEARHAALHDIFVHLVGSEPQGEAA